VLLVKKNSNITRPPGKLVPFYNRCLFSISPHDLRAPSADRRETMPRDRYPIESYIASPKIWGPSEQY